MAAPTDNLSAWQAVFKRSKYWSISVPILHFVQKEGMCRYGFSGIGTYAAFHELPYPFRIVLSPAHFHERADHGSDHVPEKPVSPDSEDQIVPVFAWISSGFINGAD